MSSFDKTVKLACKPKAAPPKAKYLDPIIAATYSEDGSVHDVCKALAPRFREPNAIVVFKALIVLHTMIRNGATDNVLSYLSNNDVLRLRNVSTGQWEGYNAPQNMQHYAMYLDTRIRIYKELKHDPVRVQSEQNRDMRIDNSLEEDRARTQGHARSKTLTGRKLRVMTVEKGLLRETKAVQKALSALLECRFYMEDLGDELNITALRMLVKDLLVLFQAVNEGVINVLEHYFEMSQVDAKDALNIYRHFCKQAEQVVEYFSVAKKMQNLLNVPIPNLKHAPVSLAGALEEYINDPNFEQNRLEYRTNNAVADKPPSDASKTKTAPKQDSASSSTKAADTSKTPQNQASSSNNDGNKALVDFFSAIEEEQPNMFNPQTGSPTSSYFQQQAAHNPFHRLQAAPTGAPFIQPVFTAQQPPLVIHPDQTGYPTIIPQATSFPAIPQQPFQQPFQQQLPQQGQSSFLRPQPTGFLQPQATGSNPFRQSVLLPQGTGFPAFGSTPFAAPQATGPAFPTTSAATGPISSTVSWPSSSQQTQQNAAVSPSVFGANLNNSAPPSFGTPTRPASTPVTKNPATTVTQPLVSHQTGSRNPFGVPKPASPPPVPKPPTLFELASGTFGSFASNNSQTQSNSVGTNGMNTSTTYGQNNTNANSSSQSGTFATPDNGISNVASSFVFNKDAKARSMTTPTLTAQTTSTTNSSDLFSGFSGQLTGTTNATSASTPSISLPPLQPQSTGFAGIKAFKPTSSFGASLLESLPPIPQSAPSTPAASTNGLPSSTQPTGSFFSASNATSQSSSASPNSSAFAALNTQATGLPSFGSNNQQSNFGSSLGVGLRPQATGLPGAANPFRASMLNTGSNAFGTSFSNFGQTNSQPFSQSGLLGSGNFNATKDPKPNGFPSLV